MRKLFSRINFILQGFVLYLGMTAADFLSSMGNFAGGFHEENPFARHADGSFYPLHALGNCAVETAGIALLSASLFSVGRALGQRWAQFVASLPWLYFGWLHLDAALSNFQVKIGLYTPSLSDILKHMLGPFGR